MKNYKKYLPYLLLPLLFGGVAVAASILPVNQGGTGAASFARNSFIVSGATATSSLSATSTNPIYIGSLTSTTTNTSTFNGKLVGLDAANSWSGRISPTHSLVMQAATSTATWTGTSTPGVDAAPATIFPFAGTLNQVRCKFNAFLGVNIQINGSNIAPSYFVASTTVGKIAVTGSDTFSAGDNIVMYVGTTTSATASSGVVNGSCTLDVTETI